MIDFNLIYYFILDHPLNFTMCYSIFYSLDKTSENFWFTWSSMNQILMGIDTWLSKDEVIDFFKAIKFLKSLHV